MLDEEEGKEEKGTNEPALHSHKSFSDSEEDESDAEEGLDDNGYDVSGKKMVQHGDFTVVVDKSRHRSNVRVNVNAFTRKPKKRARSEQESSSVDRARDFLQQNIVNKRNRVDTLTFRARNNSRRMNYLVRGSAKVVKEKQKRASTIVG